MMWVVYIAAMAVLIAATPVMHWRRSKPRWDRHPGGSAGVLRDQIVSYAPTAVAVLVIVMAVSAVELGLVEARPNGFMALGVGAVVLGLGAGAGFVPPVVAARQRLLAVRSPVRPLRGHVPETGKMNVGRAPPRRELPAQPGEGA
jgi:hypothetical protein